MLNHLYRSHRGGDFISCAGVTSNPSVTLRVSCFHGVVSGASFHDISYLRSDAVVMGGCRYSRTCDGKTKLLLGYCNVIPEIQAYLDEWQTPPHC